MFIKKSKIQKLRSYKAGFALNVIIFVAAFISLPVFLFDTNAQRNNVMMNVGGSSDYETDRAFCDVMRVARKWNVINSNPAINVPVDSKGWPTTDAEVIVWHGIKRMHGTYKLRFTGHANLNGSFCNNTITNQIYDAQTNITTADITINNAEDKGFKLAFSGTSGGVKNVKMMRPIYPGSSVSYAFTDEYQPDFINLLKQFNVIRFLAWNGINGNLATEWNTRVVDSCYWPSHQFIGANKGKIAVEASIRACNEANVGIWAQIPVSATDDYVFQLATLLKNMVKPNLKIYVEFANELWNTAGSFPQSGINHQAAIDEVNAGNSSLKDIDGTTNDWVWAFRRIAKRGTECSLIFRSVFGDSEMMTRVRPVIQWQRSNGQGTAAEALKWMDYYSQLNNKPITYYFYGGGGSAYYSPNTRTEIPLDDLWSNEDFAVNNWIPDMKKDVLRAAAMGLKLTAYEGGPGLDDYGINEAVKAQAVLDPRMKTCMLEHHKAWNEFGGDMLGYFYTNGDYQWGFCPDILDWNNPGYPKVEALNEILMAERDTVTFGHSVPFSADGAAFDLTSNTYNSPSTGTQTVGRGVGRNYGYLFHANAGVYKANFEYSNATNASAKIIMDGTVLTIDTLNGSATTPFVYIALDKGIHMIRIYQNSSTQDFKIVKVNVEKHTVGALPMILTPIQFATFQPGENVTATGTGDNLSWEISTTDGIIKSGIGESITFKVPDTVSDSIIKIKLIGGSAGNEILTHYHNLLDDAPEITTLLNQTVYLNKPFNVKFDAFGKGIPFRWSTTAAPAGSSLSNAGVLTGTFTSSTTKTIDVTVTDADGDTDTKTISFEVVNDVPDITTGVSISEIINAPFSFKFSANGKGDPFSWSSENLPSGISLSTDGKLTGTLTDSVSKIFDVTVTDFDGDGSTKSFNIKAISGVECENYTSHSGCQISNSYSFTGTGFVDMGTWFELNNLVATAGTYSLTIKYMNGGSADRPGTISINGVDYSNNFAQTGGWGTWGTITLNNVSLFEGNNTIRITATTSTGGANFDNVTLLNESTVSTGSKEYKGSFRQIAFPNPATKFINVNNPELYDQVIIYDVFSRQQINTQLNGNNQVDISTLSPNIYMLRLFKKGKLMHTHKLIKL